jgi:hypothetical protein
MTHASPAVTPGHVARFDSMLKAAHRNELALIPCTDVKTGDPVAAICMVNCDAEGNVDFVPVARMFNSNPKKELLPPNI